MGSISFENRKELDYRVNEAYKTLRTNITFCGDDNKVILVTSCTPNEGKSSVSFNLAVSMAQNGKKCILLDADLRKSVLIGRYKVGKVAHGLTHYLSGQIGMEDVILESDIEHMDIIFSGEVCPNPAELLEHRRFNQLIEKLRETYDYILIDTPPLGSVIDSAVVAKVADGAVLVIESNAISYRFAQTVKDQLEKSNCRILGVIINKVPLETKGYYGKYYAAYYGTYGQSEKLTKKDVRAEKKLAKKEQKAVQKEEMKVHKKVNKDSKETGSTKKDQTQNKNQTKNKNQTNTNLG